METFDVIVVGGGPAGLSAAISAARAGMRTVVIERGDYPGTKNVMGGVIYTQPTADIIPEFWKEAPLERAVIEQRLAALTGKEIISATYRDPAWGEPPYNAHTVLRVKFDHWLAKKAESLGVMIIPETVVEDLLYQGDRVVGVRTGRAEGDLGAKVVILAEGINSFIAQKSGLAAPLRPDTVAVSVKEIIALPAEKIEDRFCLEQGQGATIELFGDSVDGMLGTGIIYTNKESLSIGVLALVSQMVEKRWTPNDLLEAFKAHPYVRRMIAGGETKEYLAHMLPEGGYHSIPKLYRQGVLIVGDTAMLCNGVHREGSNFATASGKIAGEVAAQAIQSGDVGEKALSVYADRIRDSFILKDLHKYRNMGHFIQSNPHFFKVYPEILSNAGRMLFTVDSTPKKERFKQIGKMIFAKRSKGAILKDMFGAWRAIK